MIIKKILILSALTFNLSNAQITVDKNFDLELVEKNPEKSLKIEKALNAFLTEAQENNYSSKYVDSLHLKEHEFFFNKLASIGKNSTNFHNPSVLKSFTPDGVNYRLTVAFYGIEDEKPFIYQITELKAEPYQDHYRFYSPFKENTATFKTEQIKNVTYRFSGELHVEKANEFANFKDKLSNLTKTEKSNLEYYSFQSLDELLKSYGFLYSARQCNFLCYDLGFTDNEGQVFMTGTNNENYIFGYLGDFLYYSLPNEDIMYKPFIIGLSTYYGGYGLTYDSMEELKQQFREELNKNPEIDFLEEFKKGRKASINRHFSYYVMSAFISEKVLKEKGFDAILDLAYSGKKGEFFFEKLNNIINVNEANFHETILQLIKLI